jgi:hypothetical protein
MGIIEIKISKVFSSDNFFVDVFDVDISFEMLLEYSKEPECNLE